MLTERFMGSQIIANSTLLLRILTLLALAASAAVFIINTFRDHLLSNGSEVTFKDVKSYRFVFSASIIGAAYTVIQLPFALYHAVTKKRMIRHECWPDFFDFYGDKVIGFLLAAGIGAGFAASLELRRFTNQLFDAFADANVPNTDALRAPYNKFFNRGIIATALLSLGFLFVAGLSILSSINRSPRRGFFR